MKLQMALPSATAGTAVDARPGALHIPSLEQAIRFRRLAERHPLWRHPFLRRCDRTLEPLEISVLLSELHKVARAFPRALAAMIADCPSERARTILVEMLWEEHGKGQKERRHSALLEHAISMLDAEFKDPPASPPQTEAFIETLMGLSERHGYLGAIAGLCYGSEVILSRLHQRLSKGIGREIAFFKAHGEGSQSPLERFLLQRPMAEAEIRAADSAIRAVLEARCLFFNGVQQAARNAGKAPKQ